MAVLEKGWLGGGNTGRNTTIIRSNYLQDASAAIYEKARGLYETLSQDLNYNIMFSPRGVMMLAQTEHEVRGYLRTAHANSLQGVATEFISPKRVKELCPIIALEGPRYPVLGALWQPRGGTARHDAVAWGYARACSDMGMDIIQQCEVTGIRSEGGQVTGVETTKRPHRHQEAGDRGGRAFRASGRYGRFPPADRERRPASPCFRTDKALHGCGRHGQHGAWLHEPIGQGRDGHRRRRGRLQQLHAARQSFHHVEETVRALIETFPMISRLKMLRWWGGIVDMTGDRSPIISKTPLGNCFINCGWGTGGFKAIPGSGWAMAELVAKGEPGPLAAEFGLDRFREGRFIDESVAAGVAH